MASYNELNALIDAYINRNGVQAITGQILNGVLKAMVEQLGRGYTIMGAATPTTDPGTPDGPECYFASAPGTYTDFDGLQIVPGELALLCYTPTDGWTKATIYEGFRQVQATIDGNVGTPSVGVSYAGGVLSFDFHNMKGNPGQNGQDGQDGDAAGFGTIGADITGGVGTPGVTVESSGPATAKNLQFHFTNLKGETGVTSVVATVDNTTGTPACTVSLVGQQLTLAFSGLKGAQGDTGSSVDYPYELVNNCTTNDATKGLSAAQGKVLKDELTQLEHEIGDIDVTPGTTEIAVPGWEDGKLLFVEGTNAGNTGTSTAQSVTDYINIASWRGLTLNYMNRWVTNDTINVGMCFYDARKVSISGKTFRTGAAENTIVLDSVFVPLNAVYARFTFRTSEKADFELYNIYYNYTTGLGKRVSDVEYATKQVNGYGGLPVIKSNAINYSNGNMSSANSADATDFILLNNSRTLRYARGKSTGNTAMGGMAFYDANKDYISGERFIMSAQSKGYEDAVLQVPSNAVYARFTFWHNIPGFYVYLDGSVGMLAYGETDSSGKDKIHPVTEFGESQSGVITSSYTSEYAIVDVTKYRGKDIIVNNIHSATGCSQVKDENGVVLMNYSGEDTSVGVVRIPTNAKVFVISNDFTKNPDFYIAVPENAVRKNGLIFGENFLSDYDGGDFSQFNGTVTDGYGLVLPGTGASNGLIVDRVIALDNWSLVADLLTANNSEVVNLGTKITQKTSANHSTRVEVDFGNGTIKLYNNSNGNLAQSGNISSIVSGNIYTIKLERIDRAIKATLINRTTGLSVSIESPDGADGSGNEGKNPAGKMFDQPVYYVGSGSPYLQNFYASCIRNAKVLIVGDSITAGAHTTWETSWAPMVAVYFGNSLTGGRGSGGILCCLNQLRSLLPIVRPKAVIVTIGTNYQNAISESAYTALFKSIVNVILAYGATPIINNVPACDARSAGLTIVNGVISSLKQIGCRFDLATSINNTWADGQDSQYYYTDNVHLNVAGNALLYGIITTQLGWLKNI